MTCEVWRDQIEGYIDGELGSGHEAQVADHLRGCADCNAFAADAIHLKRSIAQAGRRYQPTSEFRDQIIRSIGAKPSLGRALWMQLALAAAVIVVAVVLTLFLRRSPTDVTREIADIHLNVTASANPVDVVSTDMHTVKPWFQGKLPFTFNVPEVAGSPYTLVGGRVVYVRGEPCALLLFQYRLHRISTVIGPANVLGDGDRQRTLSSGFHIAESEKNNYAFVTIGDASMDIVSDLNQRVRAAQ